MKAETAPVASHFEVWHGCFDDSWRDVIAPEAFAHPAKFSRGLIERIIIHGLSVGWWEPGSTIGDPFGGIGTGGVIAAYHGLAWKGVELEPRFCKLAKQNFDLHVGRWNVLGSPLPELFQGDSRKFASIIGKVAAVVTSPPYNKPFSQDHNGSRGGHRSLGDAPISEAGAFVVYGHTEGQIEGMPNGDLDAVVTSPPYAKQSHHGGDTNAAKGIGRNSREQRPTEEKGNHNLTRLYGSSPGQIDELTSETYWQAMAQVYSQCFLALRPGGVACINVKDYVKDKARVPLCDQTFTLLQSIGFLPVTRIHAMLVKEHRSKMLFGGDHVHLKERKSFFRRLAEKNGSPRIDHEEVLVVRKPEVVR